MHIHAWLYSRVFHENVTLQLPLQLIIIMFGHGISSCRCCSLPEMKSSAECSIRVF